MSAPASTMVPPGIQGGDLDGAGSNRPEDRILRDDEGPDIQDESKQPLLPGLTQDLEKELMGLVTRFEEESYPSWRFL